MQVRCTHCGRPYAVSKEEVHALLDQIVAEDLKHQNSFCPHCGKRNRHSRKQLETAEPGWSPPPKETDET
jgi:endogenous inhibitor of DNA gyrase (YacG/DUF329 family)